MDVTGIGLAILSTVTIINVHSGDVLESASQAVFTVRLIKVSIIKMLGPNTEAGLAEAAVVPVLVSGVKTLAPVDLHSIRTITTSSPTTMTTGMSTTIMMTRMRIIDLAATGRNIKRLRLEAGLSVREL